MSKHAVGMMLAVIFVLSVAALFLANDDPFARDAFCAHFKFCLTNPDAKPKPWNKIVYDLAVGASISVLFYWLVVWLPDYQRRQRLKRSLNRHYSSFRQDCIEIMLQVADRTYAAGFSETLLQQDKFKDYFKQRVPPGDRSRWDEFLNKLDEYHLRELLTRMEIFRDEIAFVLNNTDIPKDEPFDFLKRLSSAIYSMKDVTLGYDETKPLAGFLWTVFSGWDWTTGYRKEDIVEKMINSI